MIRAGEPKHWQRSTIESLEVSVNTTINSKTFYQHELITHDQQRHTVTDKISGHRDVEAPARHLSRDLNLT